jgi:hypothetical protein
MSPLSLSACFSHFCFISCILYLTLPRVRPFSPQAGSPGSWFCWHWAGGGGCGTYAVRQGRPCHWPRRSHDPKGPGPIPLALGSWRWGGGEEVPGRVGGGMGTRNEGEGGWRIFYHRPVPTSITLAFFKSMHSFLTSCGIKRPTISRLWSLK